MPERTISGRRDACNEALRRRGAPARRGPEGRGGRLPRRGGCVCRRPHVKRRTGTRVKRRTGTRVKRRTGRSLCRQAGGDEDDARVLQAGNLAEMVDTCGNGRLGFQCLNKP
ncbi:hypothetical protein HMPREF0972_01491 [Actinomyces sp. oral taxon 848 str. F0332]|nr:hypothetical protein HMPREF0972_01491 [Actinomyces sp. oral taxon 848 str. F0332]